MKRMTVENPEMLKTWAENILKFKISENAHYLGQTVDGELRAVIVYCDFLGKSCAMHIATKGGNWMDRKLLWFAFYYPFIKLNVKVILGIVSSANEKALKLDRHLGFEETVTIADAHDDGDLVIFTMRPHQCRWLTLGGKYGC